jgi:patatin-related protein
MRPDFELEQEMRFAVVMYGGVSLAIYINGVAQELFRLVRATAPEAPYTEGARHVYFPTGEKEDGREPLDGSERVYRSLGQMLNVTGHPDEKADPDAPVRTRFVVDIISGTSAGGINGIFLGRAIAEQQDFGISADLWRETADIGELLNDEKSYKGLPAKASRDAQSLLNGLRLYWKAREALRSMAKREVEPADEFRPAYAEQLDLAVTSTDLGGLPLPIRLSDDKTVLERSHRAVFRFTYGTEDATGEDHSDFDDTDLMLGFAARATSSFPFAFEPVCLTDLRKLGFNLPADDAPVPEDFFSEYRRFPELAVDDVVFGDGGYLDNKPFSYATEALRGRRADVPVSRRLVYIEPHPTDEEPAEVIERPDVFGSVGASFALPRQETIRADVAAVSERNHVVERLRELGLSAEDALDPDTVLDTGQPPYVAYVALRVRSVLDALTELGLEIKGAQPDDTIARKTREALRTWIAGRTFDERTAFLREYDAAFRQRRLSFLHDRINELLRGGEAVARMVGVAGRLKLADVKPERLPEQAQDLRNLKLALNGAIDGLRRTQRAPYSDNVKELLGERSGLYDDVVTRATGLPGSVDEYLDAVEKLLAAPLTDADANIRDALEKAKVEPWIAGLLVAYDKRFEEFDMIVLPLAYPDLGETNSVDILRISPLDAPGIKPDAIADATAKLAGIRVKHFGGFLERSWRDNDLMWGRLDAAEAIVGATFGDTTEGTGKALRERAQAEILRDELRRKDSTVLLALGKRIEQEGKASLDAMPDATLVACFRQCYEPLPDLAPKRERAIVGRGIGIAGRVLSVAAKGRAWPRWPFRSMRVVGPSAARTALWVKRTASLRPHVQLWPPRVTLRPKGSGD